jgi:hypothetical protein
MVNAESSIESGKDIQNDTFGTFPELDYVSIIGTHLDHLEAEDNLSKVISLLNTSEKVLAEPLLEAALLSFRERNGKEASIKDADLISKRVGLGVLSKLCLMKDRLKENRRIREQAEEERMQSNFNGRLDTILASDELSEAFYYEVTKSLLKQQSSKLNDLRSQMINYYLEADMNEKLFIKDQFEKKKDALLAAVCDCDDENLKYAISNKVLDGNMTGTIPDVPSKFVSIYKMYLSEFIDLSVKANAREWMESNNETIHL